MFQRAAHRRWIRAIVIGGCLAMAGCFETCQSSVEPRSQAQTSLDAWPFEVSHARVLPARVNHLVFVRELQTLERGLAVAWRHLGTDSVPAMADVLSELAAQKTLAQSGLALESAVVGFHLDGRWGMLAQLNDREQLQSWLGELETRDPFELRDTPNGWELVIVRKEGESRVVSIRAHGERVAWLWPSSLSRATSRDRDETELAWVSGQTPPRQRWRRDSTWRQLIDQTTRGDEMVVAAFDPVEWFRGWQLEGRARQLLDRFARQLGEVGIRGRYRDSDRTLAFDVYTPRASGAPSVISGLGQPDGTLPPLGGLVEPGVLGVVRLSADAMRLYGLVRSLLPAERRQQLDRLWTKSEQRLKLEGPERIVGNMSGHAVAVIYGIEGERLDWKRPGLARRLLELETTREAILLPIHDRTLVERTLDVFTQLSGGRLSRQNAEHTVHYAWVEKGRLEWAFILSDDHLIYVDSSAAFDQAMIYEQRGGTVLREMEAIAPLLRDRHRSGLYLDTATLADILSQSGEAHLARWLKRFQSALVIGRSETEPPSTRFEFRLAPP